MQKSIQHIAILLFCCLSLFANGQNHIQFICNDSIVENKPINKEDDIQKILNNTIFQWQSKSFLTANIDSTIVKGDSVFCHLYLGKKFKVQHIVIPKKYHSYFASANIEFSDSIEIKKFETLSQQLLLWFENNGYPFAQIRLDGIIFQEAHLSAFMVIEPRQLIRFNDIIIKGNLKVKTDYIQQLLKIKKGDIYNESRIQKINSILSKSSFIHQEKSNSLRFDTSSCFVTLYLNRKACNQFDGLISFQPNTESISKKFNINGYLNLKLVNSIDNHGDLLDIRWTHTEKNSQSLLVETSYPFILNTPFDINYQIKILKKDTLYNNTYHKLGVGVYIDANNYFDASWINVSNTYFGNSSTSSDYGNIRSNLLNLAYKYSSIDNIYNPRKGLNLTLSGGFGKRQFLDSTTSENVLEFESTLDYYIPIKNRSCFLISNKSGTKEGSELYLNEYFHLGGFSDIRGFNEESIFAFRYSIFNFEYRYLIGKYSYFSTFYTFALLNEDFDNQTKITTPMSAGIGISIETKAGILNLNIALGKNANEGLNLNDSKFHFGYVNVF